MEKLEEWEIGEGPANGKKQAKWVAWLASRVFPKIN